MNRTMNFNNPIESIGELAGRTDLRMVLWAGDCIHNGITDIERLPNFDVYLCIGFPQTLSTNVDYIYNRSRPGIICIIDATDKEQMYRFIELFQKRFLVIDSDYNGNTPTLPRNYYNALLSDEGKAFNVKGINGCVMPTEDFQNCMELFAPMLSVFDNYRRTWTAEIVNIASVDGISPGAVWTSLDFRHSYYDGIRARQEQLMEWNKNRNPVKSEIWKYSKDTMEEYWSLLPLHILTVNFEKTNILDDSFREYAVVCKDRFKSFILEETIPMIKTPDEFREYAKTMSIKQIQECYWLCKEYPGIEFGLINDNRNGKEVYGYWIKNAAL